MKCSSFLLLVTCSSLLVASCMAQPQYQIDALMDFYNSTSGSHWIKSTRWGTGLPCQNNWYGVSCDSNNNIIAIKLKQNKLKGTFPESFGQLSNLRSIELSQNYVEGSFPQSFSNLTSLTYLNLFSNSLKGKFPDVLFSLDSLNYFDLGANNLFGQLPDKFDSFSSLTTLNLDGNYFSGSVPATILNNLKNCYISLGSNEIASIPWDQWINSNSLSNSSLILDLNRVSGSLSYQIYWPKSISLESNLFTGILPDLNTSYGIPQITHLSVLGNKITGNLPVSLTKASYLNFIEVSYNHAMSGVIPVQYASIPKLDTLYFSRTGLTCPQDNAQWDNFQAHAQTSCPPQK